MRGSHHTHAIYGNNLYLLSDPLNDIYREATQWHANAGEKISDLYVIAHGWNFTTEEALANYYGYLEVAERRIAAVRREDPTYNPYFVFVVWPSAIRPLSSLVGSLLPFQIDRLVTPLTQVIDRTLFFIPSVWKQSLNAYRVAIGKKSPSFYDKPRDYHKEGRIILPRLTCGTTTPNSTESFTIDSSPEMGRDCPLSFLLNHIIDWKRRFSPTTHIHLVGHSFGAKMVAWTAVDALATLSSKNRVWPQDQIQAIESLVLLNPAFAPGELEEPPSIAVSKLADDESYFFGKGIEVRERLLEIPQKVLVYSDRDYATGRVFDFSQLFGANSINQFIDHNMERIWPSTNVRHGPDAPVSTQIVSAVLVPAINSVNIGQMVAFSLILGPLSWTGAKLFDLPYDFVYHVKKNDLFMKQEEAMGYRFILRGALNALDYILPILHVVRNDPADRMGILRNSSAALGSTGWNLASAGRKLIFPSDLSSLVEKEQTPPTLFCDYSSRILNNSSSVGPDETPHSMGTPDQGSYYTVLDPNVFNSFDGTTVLDTWYPPDGAHGDVRSTEPPSHCSAQDEHGRPLQKREMIFNFLYNVTHARLVPGLRSGVR